MTHPSTSPNIENDRAQTQRYRKTCLIIAVAFLVLGAVVAWGWLTFGAIT